MIDPDHFKEQYDVPVTLHTSYYKNHQCTKNWTCGKEHWSNLKNYTDAELAEKFNIH